MIYKGLNIDLVESCSKKRKGLFSQDKTIECSPTELCLLLFNLSANASEINLVQLNFRIDELDLYTAYDIALAVENCKRQNIIFIGFSEELSLEHFLAICFCDFRICPPLSGILSFSLNFKHFVLNDTNEFFQSVKIGDKKLPLATFASDKLDESALQREKELGIEMLKKCIKVISRAIPNKENFKRTYSTAVELTENHLLTHVCYEEFLTTNISILKKVSWSYIRINRINLFSSWSKCQKNFKDKICILEVNSNSWEELNSLNALRKQIKFLFNLRRINGLLVIVNYKGGSYESADRIWCLLNALKKKFPVYSYIKVAASSGYCIASAGDRIFINPCGYLGNVGTVLVTPNYDNIFRKLGVDVINNIASPLENNLTEAGILKIKAEIAFTLFINRIAESRKLTTEKVSRIMDGTNFSSTLSVENNFADSEATLISVLWDLKQSLKKNSQFIFIKYSSFLITRILHQVLPIISLVNRVLK